jgi:hypothetical protein
MKKWSSKNSIMAVDHKKRQKKLAKKKNKRKTAISAKKRNTSFGERISRKKALIVAKNSSINSCLIRKNIFSEGIGTAIISREMPNDYLGVGVFLLDVWCLGVKNTYFSVLSENEYTDRIKEISIHETLENIHPACARKLIEQCIHYSDALGFKPHKDFKISRRLLMDVDPNVCPNQYIFGKDGKPFYISGPNENLNQSRQIINSLLRNCGEGNFDYLMSVSEEIE